MKKLIRYLLRDKIDLIMFALTVMFTILFFIKTPDISADLLSEGNFSFWLPVLCLFILGSTIWTKGTMGDLLNLYVTNPEYRLLLNLSHYKPKKPFREKIFGIVFALIITGMLILFFIILLKS
jgi:hypothetical protein